MFNLSLNILVTASPASLRSLVSKLGGRGRQNPPPSGARSAEHRAEARRLNIPGNSKILTPPFLQFDIS